MKLTEIPELVNWPETLYLFLERVGPFQNTAHAAWQELHARVSDISKNSQITGYLSLYKREPKIYRAGVSVASEPSTLPKGLEFQKFSDGKYSRFVLTGPYSDLPAASGRVFEIVAERKIRMRDDYCIENYLTDARTAPHDQDITEILTPTRQAVEKFRLAATDKMDDFVAIARGDVRFWPHGPGQNIEIALDGDTARLQSQFAKQVHNRGAGFCGARLAIHGNLQFRNHPYSPVFREIRRGTSLGISSATLR
jgi:DNA gyrase inhibitor GyrI